MKQLEIEFFWPLTEQIPLDLDFTESDDFYEELFHREMVSVMNHTGVYAYAPTTNTFKVQPSPIHVGHWNVSGENFQIHRDTKPNWFHRMMNKLLINWEWKDKK
jgi:hypothetical protein